MDFLVRDDVAAVLPPWGGERAIEVLEQLDFERLARSPVRFFMGYSDISTLLLPLLLRSGWATVHGPQLMDHVAAETERLTTDVWRLFERALEVPFEQQASQSHQTEWRDYAADPDVTFALGAPTRWEDLRGEAGAVRFEGRLVGGCLDTLMHLAGTPYGDVPAFVQKHRARGEGVVLFLENAGLSPMGVLRALTNLRLAGWLDGLSGIILGRSGYKQHVPEHLVGYRAAVEAALGGVRCPVILDADIGHVPPQLSLVLGAHATVTRDDAGLWRVVQRA
jgi:muramoyltetrapeptide carboxypeptidase LdcA involved in peptidoglycan recycling